MAVTNEKSDQITNQEATPPVMSGVDTLRGKLKFLRFSFTQGGSAGDILSDAELCKLPAGVVRVFLEKSYIATSAHGTSATLSLGWQEYTDTDGDTVLTDADGLDNDTDTSAAGAYKPVGTVGGDETYLFESNGGVTLIATITGAVIPAAATIKGYIAYIVD